MNGGFFATPLGCSGSGVLAEQGGGEKRIDLSGEIAWFGNMLHFGDKLNMEGPLVEIGSRSVFVNSVIGSRQ